MLLSTKIQVRVNGRTAKRYRDLGYEFNHVGDEITINVFDLSQYSEEPIHLRCDYCGTSFSRKYADHYRIINNPSFDGTDACGKCKVLKSSKTCMEKYGVPNPLSAKMFQDKARQTIWGKYGVENISHLPEVRRRAEATNLERYGTKYPSQLQSTREKVIATNRKRFGIDYPMSTQAFQLQREQTCLEKYGVPHHFQSELVKQKYRDTCRARYGVENVSLLEEVREKVAATKYKNSSQSASRQQVHICSLIGAELNYPFKRYFIDMAFPDDKIAIEYNGSGHDLSVRLGIITQNKFIQNETYRKKQLYEDGWKLITIISSTDKLPTDDYIASCIHRAMSLLQERHWAEIDLDLNELRTSHNTYPIHKLA